MGEVLVSGITVAIPVGPHATDQQWLDKGLESVRLQTRQPDEVLLIDDMAGLPQDITDRGQPYPIRIWRSPWRLGVATAFNVGVALANNDLVFLLADDDWMEPECLEACLAEYERRDDPLGFYHVTIRIDIAEGYVYKHKLLDPPVYARPGTAAMVTKQLWRHTGGYPLESGMAPVETFIQLLLSDKGAGHLYPVRRGEVLYHGLAHSGQASEHYPSWRRIAVLNRLRLLQEWEPANWGRYE